MQTNIKYTGSDAFLKTLKRRVDRYFQYTGKSPRDCPQMYFKTASILAWLFGVYALLLFVATSWWFVGILAVVLGLAIAAVGFNIQHDAGHKAYSKHDWVNKLFALTLDLVGGSSYLWDWKHNRIHHTYPNIDGHDDDINIGIFGRLSPSQPRYWFHRVQGIYLWFLYGLLAIKWHFFDDFYNIAVAKIGDKRIARPRGRDLAVFIAGKVIFFSMAFVIPMLLHPVLAVLLVYAIAAFVSGVVLSVVFQLAHCVEEADFPLPDSAGTMSTDWAVHQVQTTVDFSRRNRLLSWYVGGLNFQVEHHLLHKISHIHYPAIAQLVESTCQKFGLRYATNKTFFGAVASHYRWLHRMGQPNT